MDFLSTVSDEEIIRSANSAIVNHLVFGRDYYMVTEGGKKIKLRIIKGNKDQKKTALSLIQRYIPKNLLVQLSGSVFKNHELIVECQVIFALFSERIPHNVMLPGNNLSLCDCCDKHWVSQRLMCSFWMKPKFIGCCKKCKEIILK